MAEDLVFLSPNTLTPTETCRETGRRQRQKDGHKHTCAYTVGGVFCSLRAFYIDLQKPGVWVSRCTTVRVQAADAQLCGLRQLILFLTQQRSSWLLVALTSTLSSS